MAFLLDLCVVFVFCFLMKTRKKCSSEPRVNACRQRVNKGSPYKASLLELELLRQLKAAETLSTCF